MTDREKLEWIIDNDGKCFAFDCDGCPLFDGETCDGYGLIFNTLPIAKAKLKEMDMKKYKPQIGDEVSSEVNAEIVDIRDRNIFPIVIRDENGAVYNCKQENLTLISRKQTELQKAEEMYQKIQKNYYMSDLSKQLWKAIEELKGDNK